MCVPLGEKLDYKACESLEEILKRVQFKVIDLEQTNLDEDVRTSHSKNSFPSFPLFLLRHAYCYHLLFVGASLSYIIHPLCLVLSLRHWQDVECLSWFSDYSSQFV